MKGHLQHLLSLVSWWEPVPELQIIDDGFCFERERTLWQGTILKIFSINLRKNECYWKISGRITKIRKVKNVEPTNMSDIYKSSLLRTGINHPINDMSDSGHYMPLWHKTGSFERQISPLGWRKGRNNAGWEEYQRLGVFSTKRAASWLIIGLEIDAE